MTRYISGFLISLCLFISNASANEKYFFYLGGGGEPAGPTTIFDVGTEKLNAFTQNSEWKSTSLFNGGHTSTETILKSTFKNSPENKSFTKENFEDFILNLKEKIKKGEIKKNDQIFIAVNSHGMEKQKKEQMHSVSLAGTDSIISLDLLISVSDLAKKAGVKMAVADFSCHSGNSQSLALLNSDICVISSSGPNNLTAGSALFENLFIETSGKNLEDLFLKAVEKDQWPNFPMISTNENKALSEQLQKIITPYLYYNYLFGEDSDSYGVLSLDKRSQKYLEGIFLANKDCISCYIEKRDQDFKSLKSQIEKISKTLSNSDYLNALLKSLEEYEAYQIRNLTLYKNYLDSKKEIIKILKTDFPDFLDKVFAYDLAIDNIDEVIQKFLNEKDRAASVAEKNDLDESIAWLNNIKTVQSKVLSQLSPEMYAKFDEYRKFIKYEYNHSYSLSLNVGNSLRKYYLDSYKKFSDPKKSNQCRDFKL